MKNSTRASKQGFLRKHNMAVFLALCFWHYIAANFAHPITPSLIVNLNLPSYMFGAAFAGMAFTNFLFSPFWGKMRDYLSPKKLLLIGSVGYGIGQYLFSIMTGVGSILFARCFSGFFVGAISVSTLVYIVEMSDEADRGKNLARLAIVQSVASAVGFLIGGSIGVYSVKITFLSQTAALVLGGILFYFLPLDKPQERASERPKLNANSLIREINPLKSFMASRVFMTKSFAVMFAGVLFAYIGTNAFDQCFNYYLKDQFGLSSVYNGGLKAATGILTLIVNSTAFVWIVKKFEIKKASAVVLAFCAVSVIAMLGMKNLLPFIISCMVFYAFNALYIPLLQDAASRGVKENANMVMAFYNAMKSLGMIIGALVAGFIYDYGAKLPFVYSAVFFALAAVMLFLNRTSHVKSHRSGSNYRL